MVKENKDFSRREFFKKTGVIAGGVLFASLLSPLKAAQSTEKSKSDDTWYGIGLDIEKCIGCASCARACKAENDVPKEPFFFRSWVEQYTITNSGEVKVQSPNGGIDGYKQPVPESEIFKTFFVPKMCNHCSKSPCTQVCPVGATFVSPDGVVLVDPNYCVGCRYCVQACPYGCRYIKPDLGTVDKCTLCYHRLKKGMDPACMMVCPTGARLYGNLRDPKSEMVKFIKNHTVGALKPNLNTGSKLYYNALSQEVH